MVDFDSEKWLELGITSQFVSAAKDMGFGNPTEIQLKAIPQILSGQSVIGIAQTGTGKTAAYVLPILNKLKFPSDNGPRALVLVPTKELVVQIHEHVQRMAANTELRISALYGGVGPKSQIETLTRGADIVVSTPGRFEELYLKGHVPCKNIKLLVVDEADRLMDMHFMPQLRRVFEWLPPKRQNMLFSATFSQKVDNLAGEFIEFPYKIEVTPQATAAQLVEQTRYALPNFKTKLNLLLHLFQREEFKRVIIFCRTKDAVTNLSKFLIRNGCEHVRAIHSNIGQNSRINAVQEFSMEEKAVLVSTDVASRGIDVKLVSHVINFDVPVVYDDYVHRIGRTGRALATGKAITFVTPSDEYHIKKIEKLIREKIKVTTLPTDVTIEETPFSEFQFMAREMDRQKRIENPEYKGAFHDRKKKRK